MPLKEIDGVVWYYVKNKNKPSGYARLRAVQIECEFCHKTFWRDPNRLSRSPHHYCSKKCSAIAEMTAGPRGGDKSPAWKGGRRKTSKGYIIIFKPDHPYATKRGLVMEHRLIMETVLGRHLLPTESVHHKNGIRDDNRPENLELWIKSQPSGQRVEDVVAWAKEILKLYGEPLNGNSNHPGE